MKTIKTKQTFKSVSTKQVELFPALADRLGKKRPVVEFELSQYEPDDIAMLVTDHTPLLLTCLNDAIAMLAKQKFAANPADWNYSPSADDLSLAQLAASFESQSRGRVLTLESAGKLAAWLQRNVMQIATVIQTIEPGYKAEQFTAIVAVIAKYTAYEAKGSEFLAKVLMRLEQIMEAIGSNDELAEAISAEPELISVMDALTKKFSKSMDDEISEDAL